MELHFQVRMNPKLYLRDPEQSELGRNIIRNSIELIHEMGFEDFTFKKLSQQVGTTEASIYRYFVNKTRLFGYNRQLFVDTYGVPYSVLNQKLA